MIFYICIFPTSTILEGENHGLFTQLTDISLTHISLASHFWDLGNTPRSDAADQGLHCLLVGISIRNRFKMKKYTRHLLNEKLTSPIYKAGIVH